MKIKIAKPPIYDLVAEQFDIKDKPVVFTYGDVIYNPLNVPVPDHLVVHEQVHTAQQGDDPKGWWYRYLDDVAFRIAQEVEAYGQQYRYICSRIHDRNLRDRFLSELSYQLSSEIYGKCISWPEARSKIRNAAKTTHITAPIKRHWLRRLLHV